MSAKGKNTKHKFQKPGEYCVHVVFDVDYSKPHPDNGSPLPMVYHTAKNIIAMQPKKYIEYVEAKENREALALAKNRNADAIALEEKKKSDAANAASNAAANAANNAANTGRTANTADMKNNYTERDLAIIAKLNTNDVPKILLENIYFDKNKSTIREDAKAALDRNIKKLKAIKGVVIQVEANTDSRGTDDYNIRLSNDRAYEVIKYFGAHGIKRSQIITVALGKKHLVNNCTTGTACDETEHQKNRRDDFVILGTLK